MHSVYKGWGSPWLVDPTHDCCTDLTFLVLPSGKSGRLLMCGHQTSCYKVQVCKLVDLADLIWHHNLILVFVTLLNELSYRQDKRMDELNLFIDYHTKYIVSIIWARPSLLFTCPMLTGVSPATFPLCWQLQECSCTLCNFSQIESYQTFSSCNPLSMEDEETLILLYH